MRKFLFFLLLTASFTTCKKGKTSPPNNNELKATVILSSGSTLNFNATGVKVKMEPCSTFGFGFGTSVEATTENNHAIFLTAYGTTPCITVPGTYSTFSIQYRPNVTDPNTAIYEGGGNASSVTFTAINDHTMEGHFTAVVCRCISTGCVSGVDYVTITGTFKGNHMQ